MSDFKNLKLNTNNPRTISKVKYEKLLKSIETFTKMLELRPIIYDENDVIWGGNMRYTALMQLHNDGKVELKPEYFKKIEGYTEEEKKEFAIRDNVELGDWDMDILANEWSDLPLDDWGIDTKGWEKEVEEDEAPEVSQEEPKSKLGEIYQLGRHRLMCGDSTKIEDVEKLMNGNKADMVFTDPPYGYSYESNYQNKHKELLNDDKILDFLPNGYLYTNDDVAFYVFCGWQTIKQWIEKVEQADLKLKNIIIWKKNNWSMGDLKGAYGGQYEVILFAHKGRVELRNGRGQDIWEFNRVPPKEHPTMKPIELCQKAINDVTINDNLILDLFLGSGSTMVASHQLKRKCYGMELDPKYCQVIIDRMLNSYPDIEVKINGHKYRQLQTV